jgi:membrane-associated phospholipid phosphatase
MAAVLLPPFLHRPAAARRYLLALIIATLLTAAIFALWPAIGPWVTEGFLPTAPQLRVTRYLTQLKSPRPLTLDFDAAAIVSFPSFHVVLALLSAVALSGLPRIRLVAWTLAILTCLSTLTTGWHYGIDLAGGCAIAWIAHRAAAALYPFLVPQPIAHTPASASAVPGSPELKPRSPLPNSM